MVSALALQKENLIAVVFLGVLLFDGLFLLSQNVNN